MRRFDKKEKIRRANILLEERMRNLKEYGSEFGPEGEFDDSELQGQEDFYDNMNRNSKEETSDVNEERPITARYGDDPTPEEKEFIANFVKTSGDKEETSDVNEDEFTDDILNKSNPKEPIVRKDLVGKPNKAVPSLSVEYAIEFVPSGTFSAVHAAESYLSDMDYTAGSMERDAPIGFSNKYNRISKWWNMTRDEHKLLDGVMISDDFREGGVTILFFTPPNF